MADEIRIEYQALRTAVGQVLATLGMPAPVRDIEAEIMVESDLMGVSSHGVRLLPGVAQAIRQDKINPDPHLQLLRDQAATCVLDGDYGPGRFVSAQAMTYAQERADRFGVGICLAKNTVHWGRAHAYVYRATQNGMIGLCTTNTMTSLSAWGAHAALGNNPLAIGVPRGPGQDPVVLDIAMSQAAIGKIATYLREGREVPLGWGLNEAGHPTTDPAEILASKKFLPTGDHKGAGLSLMLELLTGALTGGLLCYEIATMDTTFQDIGSSKLFLALNVEAFVGRDLFTQRVHDMLCYLQALPRSGQEILYPGQRGWQARADNLAAGIPIHPEIASQLRALGVSL